MSSSQQLSFAQTYILASKVRNKLTKEAQSPKSSLRNLVVQANMLDNIMDYISEETTRRTREYESIRKQKSSSVQFAPSPLRSNYKTSITEYEIDEDSSDDEDYSDEEMEDSSDDDEDEELLQPQQHQPQQQPESVYYEEVDDSEESEEEEQSETSSCYSEDESDDDYYIYSDEDIVKEEQIPRSLPITSFNTLPTIDLSLDTITEEEEEELPELAENYSSSEEDEEEEVLLYDLNRINLSNSSNASTTHNEKKPNTEFELSSTTPADHQPISLFRHENISLEHVF